MPRTLWIVAAPTLAVALCGSAAPQRRAPVSELPPARDISPNTANGVVGGGSSSAGLMVALAGEEAALYAVSLNAGVWKSEEGGPWRQLPNGPERACCIAIDPSDPRRIAVGERNGMAVDMRLNESGLWESRDAGRTWRRVLDPLRLPGATSQAVPGVVYTPRGTLLAATTAGVARRPRTGGRFVVQTGTSGVGAITAVCVGQSVVWARSRTHLLRSHDDGVTWRAAPFPAECGGLKIGFHSRGDAFSLAGFDGVAFMPCKPNPDTTGNHNTMLTYRADGERWSLQVLPSGDGTGLGGRRFVRSFVLRDPALPDRIGGRLQLLFGAGQEVHQALGVEADGSVRWDTPVQTSWAGPAHATNNIHADLWDVLVPAGFDPATGCRAWVACDGGVFRTKPGAAPPDGRIQQAKWVTHNDGLHTHHIHTLTVIRTPRGVRIAYPTSDNDAWWRSDGPDARWVGLNALGDANWTAADDANPSVALLVRHNRLAVLTSFGDPVPEGAGFRDGWGLALQRDQRYDGPAAFRIIQTLRGETPEHPLLGALMLAPSPAGGAGAALMRHRRFAASPNANAPGEGGWRMEASGLPIDVRGIVVAGGHAKPTVTAFGPTALYRLRDVGNWTPLTLRDEAGRPFDLLSGGQYGPIFADPFDPGRLFVASRQGVMVSRDGGATFRRDAALTALVTDSGTYPMASGELTGSSRDVILASRANALATLGHVAFDRERPGAVLVSSPFTGAFYDADGSGRWRSLRGALPAPYTPVSAVALVGADAYLATEGRSLLRVERIGRAPVACYFERAPEGSPVLAVVRDGGGSPVGGVSVRIAIEDATGRVVLRRRARSGPDGAVAWPTKLRSGSYVVRLTCDTAPGRAAARCAWIVVRTGR